MGSVKAREIQHSDVLRFEAEINNLWGELNTSNIPHSKRQEIEGTLSACEEDFKRVLGGQATLKELESKIKKCDLELADAVIYQAKNEIPKIEKTSSCCLALKTIERQLKEGKLTPVKARHEVKDIMRHNS